jgi:hypothetical protein
MSNCEKLLQQMKKDEIKIILPRIYNNTSLNINLVKIIANYKCVDNSYYPNDEEMKIKFDEFTKEITFIPEDASDDFIRTKIIEYIDFFVKYKYWVYKLNMNNTMIECLNIFKNDSYFEGLYEQYIKYF